jgi:NDP-sugar pyrophosphorylase family protein
VFQAFIPGAGLGTRLRPLTNQLPKPLVPLFHRPLVEWVMDACVRAGIHHFAINTHHLPEAWNGFGEASEAKPAAAANGMPAIARIWHGCETTLFHEPVLLETGGGLKNIEAWIGQDPVLIHNGDIFSSMPLTPLIAAHQASGLPVTLALRSTGTAKHIALDPSQTRVTDIRKMLGRDEGTHVFSGIYCVNPEFLAMIPAAEKISVIPAFLALAREGRLGAVVIDDGDWLDLGDREFYLAAHHQLALAPAIHPLAQIGHGAIVENSVVGPHAVIAAGAIVRDSVVWPHAQVAGDAVLDHCIVCSDAVIHGEHRNADL